MTTFNTNFKVKNGLDVAGNVTISGTPTAANHAATKSYTDTAISGVQDQISDITDTMVASGVTVVIDVPAQYPTIQAALASIARWSIFGTVQIKIADGTYNVSTSINANHPYGHNVQIIGNVTTPDNVVIMGPAAPTFDALYVSAGHTLGLLNGIKFDLPSKATSTNNATAILAVHGGTIVCGNAIKTNNWYYGIAARNNSTIKARYATVSNAGDVGIWAFVGSSIDASYASVSGCSDAPNSLGFGIQAEYGSAVDASNANATTCLVGGVAALSGSNVRAHNAISSGNIGSGFFARDGGTIEAHNATASSNGRYGVESIADGHVYYNSITATSNTLGNNSSNVYFDNGALGARVVATDGDLRIDNSGTGSTYFNTSAGLQFGITSSAGDTCVVATRGTSAARLYTQSSASSASINIESKGSDVVRLRSNGSAAFQAYNPTSSSVNYVQVDGSITGSPVVVSAQGTDANINLQIQAKGTGVISAMNNVSGTSFRAAAGIPNSVDSSTVGFAFGTDGDTGLFSPIVTAGSANGVVSIFANNVEVERWTQNNVTLYKPLTLSADPTIALQAATKQYADTKIAAIEKGAANGVATLGADSKVPSSQLPSYVDDVLEYANLASFPTTGETAKIYVTLDTNKIYRWSGSAYIEISPTAGNSDSATKLATARTIAASGDATWSVSFDGTTNVSSALTLANSGVTANTYGSSTNVPVITVDAKGRITTATTTPVSIPIGYTGSQGVGFTGSAGSQGATGFTGSKGVVNSSDVTTALGYTPVQQGGGTGQGTNKVYIGYTGSNNTLGLQVDVTNFASSWPINVTGNANTATYVSATQQTNVITGKQASMAMSQDSGATQGSFICRATGTGDSNLAGMTFWNDAYAVKMGIRADGYLGIGGWSRPAWSWYTDPSGNMVAAGDVTAYSDPRLKDNIRPITGAVDIVTQLNGVRFVWKDAPHIAMKAGKEDIGILATDVEAVLPELVSDSIQIDGDSYKTVAYDKIVPVLIEAIKQQQEQIDALQAAIDRINN